MAVPPRTVEEALRLRAFCWMAVALLALTEGVRATKGTGHSGIKRLCRIIRDQFGRGFRERGAQKLLRDR